MRRVLTSIWFHAVATLLLMPLAYFMLLVAAGADSCGSGDCSGLVWLMYHGAEPVAVCALFLAATLVLRVVFRLAGRPLGFTAEEKAELVRIARSDPLRRGPRE